jgi:hypothetical protein
VQVIRRHREAGGHSGWGETPESVVGFLALPGEKRQGGTEKKLPGFSKLFTLPE